MKEFGKKLDEIISQKRVARDSAREAEEEEHRKKLEIQQELQEKWLAESEKLAELGNERLLPLIRVFCEKTGKDTTGFGIKRRVELRGTTRDRKQYSVAQGIVLRREKPLPGWGNEWGEWKRPYCSESVMMAKGSILGGLSASGSTPGTYLRFEITTDAHNRPVCAVMVDEGREKHLEEAVRLDKSDEDVQEATLSIFEKLLEKFP